MSFVVHIGWWLLPLALSVAAWAGALSVRAQGWYDLGPVLAQAAALIATLLVWLIYFAVF